MYKNMFQTAICKDLEKKVLRKRSESIISNAELARMKRLPSAFIQKPYPNFMKGVYADKTMNHFYREGSNPHLVGSTIANKSQFEILSELFN